MLLIFYKKLVYINLSFLLFYNTSCYSQIDLIKNNHSFKENIPLIDNKIYSHIDDFFTMLNDIKAPKGTVILCSQNDLYSENVKEYFISTIGYDFSLFNLPCTGYIIYKEKVVLIYSKKSGFVNPLYYSNYFLEKVKKQLNGSFIIKINSFTNELCQKENEIDRIGHHNHFKIENNIKTILKYNKFRMEDYLFGNKYFSYKNYANLDNFRTIYVEDCED